MTPEDVEGFLETCGKDLRSQLCKAMQDDDDYQQASLDILRDCERCVCTEPKDFVALFCRYFLTIRLRNRSNLQSKQDRVRVYSLEEYRDSMGAYQLNQYSNDPRLDLTTEAHEYINMLPMVYRPVFSHVFIEGCTHEEAGIRLDMSHQRVGQMIREGIVMIQDTLKDT